MAAERPARPAPMTRMLRGMPVLGMVLERGDVIFLVFGGERVVACEGRM